MNDSEVLAWRQRLLENNTMVLTAIRSLQVDIADMQRIIDGVRTSSVSHEMTAKEYVAVLIKLVEKLVVDSSMQEEGRKAPDGYRAVLRGEAAVAAQRAYNDILRAPNGRT